ncbi:hypothetical protein GPJ56_009147 [Histomonas meleagridis]|uniref:uncharacterized protein n=1 Tax=Histomonas meleagridis TaxID=135588 RepID=UPI00355A4B95|nr:hypothetical protein GPJ56_009147 [Histomonas meleagridis]KAH0799099.1 hypothetical protein GO595_007896 [Histomonas meleagridis]
MEKKTLYFIKDGHEAREFIRSLGRIPVAGVSCKTQSSHGKTRSYNLIFAQTGLYFLRPPSIGHSTSLYLFISIIDIKSIQYLSKNCYIILYGDGIRQIECSNFDIIIECLIHFRTHIEYNSPIDHPLTFEGFPKPPQVQQLTSQPPGLLRERSMAINAKYQQDDYEDLLRLFEVFETTPRTYISFPSTLSTPFHYKIITYPLLCEQKLSIVRFNGNAPTFVCKLIRSLLKYSKSLTTIILENYLDMRFEQFNFETIPNPTAVSWTFNHTFHGNPERFPLLLWEFRKYQGDIQTLNFINIPLNVKIADAIARSIVKGHCFRTMEVFSAIQVETSSEETANVSNSLISVTSHLPMLHTISFTDWTNPIILVPPDHKNSYLLCKCDSLRSFKLSHANLAGITTSYEFPQNLTNLEFPNATMSSTSLITFLNSFSKINKKNATLSLNHLHLNQKSWDSFYKESTKIPTLTNLIELDWTGNPLPETFLNEFIRIFLSNPDFKFLSIAEIFNDSNIKILQQILTHLSKIRLWGIDLHGTNKCYFKDKIIDVFKSLSSLPSLEHLNISNQEITNTSLKKIFDMMDASLKLIHEISMDATQISDIQALYGAYQRLTNVLKLESIQRPLVDIDRIIKTSEEFNRYTKFKLYFTLKKKPSLRFHRVAFYQNSLDLASAFFDYYKSFPQNFLVDFDDNDKYDLTIIEQQNSIPHSLFDFKFTSTPKYFGMYQAFLFDSPYVTPSYPPNNEYHIPKSLRNCRNYANAIDMTQNNEENEKDDKTNVEEVLKQFSTFLRPSFLPVLNNIDTLNKIFKSFENEEDPFPNNNDIPQPPKYINNESILIIKAKCNEFSKLSETNALEAVSTALTQTTFGITNIQTNFLTTMTLASTIQNTNTLSTAFTTKDSTTTSHSGTQSRFSDSTFNFEENDELNELKLLNNDKSNNKELMKYQPLHLTALPNLQMDEKDKEQEDVETFNDVYDMNEMDNMTKDYNEEQKEVLSIIRKYCKSFSSLKSKKDTENIKVKPLPLYPSKENNENDQKENSYFQKLCKNYCGTLLTKPNDFNINDDDNKSIIDDNSSIYEGSVTSELIPDDDDDDIMREDSPIVGGSKSNTPPLLPIFSATSSSSPKSSVLLKIPPPITAAPGSPGKIIVPPPLTGTTSMKLNIPPPIAPSQQKNVVIPPPIGAKKPVFTIPPPLSRDPNK